MSLNSLQVRAVSFHVFWAQDKEWAKLLWESACCVTLQVRLCEDASKLALARNQASELVKGLGKDAMSDTFFTFSHLVGALKIEKLKDGEDANLRYNNAPYNASMHKAAAAVYSLLTKPGGPVEAASTQLDLLYGRSVLSNQYSKLSRLASEAKKAATSSHSPAAIAGWMIRMLTLAFQTKVVTPAKATEQWLCQDRKSGAAGFWSACLLVREAWLTAPISTVISSP